MQAQALNLSHSDRPYARRKGSIEKKNPPCTTADEEPGRWLHVTVKHLLHESASRSSRWWNLKFGGWRMWWIFGGKFSLSIFPRKWGLNFNTENFTTFFTGRKESCHPELTLGASSPSIFIPSSSPPPNTPIFQMHFAQGTSWASSSMAKQMAERIKTSDRGRKVPTVGLKTMRHPRNPPKLANHRSFGGTTVDAKISTKLILRYTFFV